jgi:hypothetical protein
MQNRKIFPLRRSPVLKWFSGFKSTAGGNPVKKEIHDIQCNACVSSVSRYPTNEGKERLANGDISQVCTRNWYTRI